MSFRCYHVETKGTEPLGTASLNAVGAILKEKNQILGKSFSPILGNAALSIFFQLSGNKCVHVNTDLH